MTSLPASEIPASTSNPAFPIVGIGASAGGIDAFHHFFDHLPSDCGMAFVMILHLPPDRTSMLAEILARWTSMTVLEGADGTKLEANHVYVPPPHVLVTLADGRLRVQEAPGREHRLLRPIDAFFDSLAATARDQAVGIVLSGTGADGALGMKAIKASGGLTMAQGVAADAPNQYSEMPDAAIATGAVDIVARVDEMPGHLLRISRRAGTSPDTPKPDLTDAMRIEICNLLRAQLGHDFSGYRSQTFLRRVQRRMQVVGAKSLQDYVSELKQTPAEATGLFRDLLIQVTGFFRDQETFEILKAKVIPHLFQNQRADGMVRLWVPGCATGEEAYSLAILLREHMDGLTAVPHVQLFATDIDEVAIAAARLGRYPSTLLEGMSAQRLQRFFTLADGSYLVAREIRELCTFSTHNLVRDPPFSVMSLVSCRNLLIYMNPKLQAQVIPIFHYALVPGGFLVLGGAESVVQHVDMFDTVDKSARIFKRRAGRSRELGFDWPRGMQSARWDARQTQVADSRPKADPARAGKGSSPAAPLVGMDSPASRFQSILGPLKPSEAVVRQLQGALSSTCEELQALGEEYQTALEELRSAIEELHSLNEELQSTNEEIETSKEELQSMNEELHTVNLRLTEKVEELDRSNSDLRNLFDSTEIATVFLDRHMVIRSFTPAIATVYNLIPSDIGRPLTDIVSRLDYSAIKSDVELVLSKLEPLERRIARDDGDADYIMRILPYRNPDSTVTGVLVTFIDVTSLVRAEAALIEADARKDVFLATLAHELRNPLAPIRTAAQILQSPQLRTDELQRAKAIISRQVTHMSALLDDLLDVSRITRGVFLLKKEYVGLQVILDDAIESAKSLIESRRHTLRIEPASTPLVLEVDPVRLTQVLSNLLTNAAKYTPPGGLITLGHRFEANRLVLFVRDNGVGLAPDTMDSVFTMFTQVESRTRRAEGGLGIGLALAKGLVELHGGHIEARSEGLGRGSEFVLFLPISAVADQRGPAADKPAPELGNVRKSILIADDNLDAAETLRMLLEHAGHRVHAVHCAHDAMRMAREMGAQVLVLDIGLPDMDGYELAERIRAEAWGKDVLLIAVTGWGQDSDKRHALAAGFDHHLTKPVDPEALARLIAE